MNGAEHSFHQAERYRYATIGRCIYCDLVKATSWSPGWPPSTVYHDKEGGEAAAAPPCTADRKHRETIDAERSLDRLEAVMEGK